MSIDTIDIIDITRDPEVLMGTTIWPETVVPNMAYDVQEYSKSLAEESE